MFDKTLAIIDVETTGGSPFLNRIIEIGLIRIEHGEVVDIYRTLLNPEVQLPEFITKLTGIKDEDLIDQPTFFEIKDKLMNYFENAVFVAHNAMFDYSFISEEFKRVGYGFSAERICTVRLSRFLYPKEKHHNLTALIERFAIECKNRHRALDDAMVLWDFLKIISDKFTKIELNEAIGRQLKGTGFNGKPDSELSYEYDLTSGQ